MADTTVDATRRLNVKKQTLDDAYAAPANFLEIDVINPITHGVGKKRYTDYEVRMRVSSVRFILNICSMLNISHICRNFVFAHIFTFATIEQTHRITVIQSRPLID